MKITVNLSALNNEQVKFLSQLGEFQDQTWESECDPDEFPEVAVLLKNAGIDKLFVHFDESGADCRPGGLDVADRRQSLRTWLWAKNDGFDGRGIGLGLHDCLGSI